MYTLPPAITVSMDVDVVRCAQSLLLLILAYATGCTLGPKQIESSRRTYNDAIQRTDKEQMLLNLVRLKYRDAPLFLEIGSVSTQHTFGSSADASLSVRPGVDLLGFSTGLSRTERPTVTYTPLVDSDFQKGLLAPINQQTLLLVTQTGWAWDRVQRLTVKNINGLDNASTAGGPTPQQAPEFRDFKFVASVFRDLQRQRHIEIAAATRTTTPSITIDRNQVSADDLVTARQNSYSFREASGGNVELVGSEQIVVLNLHPDAWLHPAMEHVGDLLELQYGETQYVVEGARNGQLVNADKSDRETLTVSTRSLLEMMYFLSQAIHVPHEHLQRGLVTVTTEAGQPFDWMEVSGDMLTVNCSAEYPQCAELAVKYRDYWFYIHESDLASKSTFDLLGELFNIEIQGGGGGNIPVLTLGL